MDNGYQAYYAGYNMSDNPYLPGTRAYAEWAESWREAEEAAFATTSVSGEDA